MEKVVQHVARAIDLAAESPNLDVIWGVLHILSLIKGRFRVPAEQAYGWCLMIWENRERYWEWETLVLLSLEVGLRDKSMDRISRTPFTGGELHQGVRDMVLRSNNPEAVTDLVRASLMFDETGALGLSICADYIIDHHGKITEPSSRHLGSFFIRYATKMGSDAPERVGREKFVELLNGLHIDVGEIYLWQHTLWRVVLMDIIWSAEAQRLAIHYWKHLAELAILGHLSGTTYNPDVTTSLMDAQEWDKLEYWVGVVWMACPPELGNVAKELEDALEGLEKKRPGALRKRMELWSEMHRKDLPESFQQTCEKLAL